MTPSASGHSPKRATASWALLMLLLGAVGGCGLKGDLYLPPAAAPPGPGEARAAPPPSRGAPGGAPGDGAQTPDDPKARDPLP